MSVHMKKGEYPECVVIPYDRSYYWTISAWNLQFKEASVPWWGPGIPKIYTVWTLAGVMVVNQKQKKFH
jgi:hypothetical protein